MSHYGIPSLQVRWSTSQNARATSISKPVTGTREHSLPLDLPLKMIFSEPSAYADPWHQATRAALSQSVATGYVTAQLLLGQIA